MNNNNNTRTRAPVAFMIGAIAGGVAALLLAPQTGPQFRKRLRHGAGELKETAREKTQSVTGAVKGAVAEAKQTYRNEIDKRHVPDTEQVARRTGA